MKILVTGHLGYVGTVLCPQLRQQGHVVIGVDVGWFDTCSVEPMQNVDKEFLLDYRKINDNILEGVQVLIHLAAYSNDPLGDLDPAETHLVNAAGTIDLAQKAKEQGVRKFIFVSSCSVYGRQAGAPLAETGPINPLTAYAQSKWAAECGLEALQSESFKVIVPRFGTAYGYSPMLRLDLVLNQFVAFAVQKNQIAIHSDGSPVRPMIHVGDMARVLTYFASQNYGRSGVWNIGQDTDQYSVSQLAERVAEQVGHVQIKYTGQAAPDQRTYRVDFSRFHLDFPDFKFTFRVREAISPFIKKLSKLQWEPGEEDRDRYYRVRWLKRKL